MRSALLITRVASAHCAAIAVALAVPAVVLGAPTPQRSRPPVTPLGTLAQLRGRSGCLVDRSKRPGNCTRVRALSGPAPFLGSDAIAITPDGKNVYVAASKSQAVTVFRRNTSTGKLTQRAGKSGCIAAGGAAGCARAIGLRGPNSVAVSPDGRNVYATSVISDAVDVFRRNPGTGALTQLKPGSGCVANGAIPGCSTGRALDGPDVVAVSPDGKSVYVGSFKGNAVAVFARNQSTGALTQPGGTTGCIANVSTSGCAIGLALAAPEGMAVSGDGKNVYVGAALSNAVDVLTRNASTGGLTQATNGTGCIVNSALTGCTTGVQLEGADAVAVSPDDDTVYVTSALSNSITTFTRNSSSGQLTQQSGTSACVIYVLAVGCSLGQALSDPEGVAVSPDGGNVYAAVFASGAVDTFNRNTGSGAVIQKPRRPGCVVSRPTPLCTLGRRLLGSSSVALSPDGKYLYSAAFASDALDVFKRVTKTVTGGRG
jgi:DNA-binding beta-propeller fold protein YncE